MFLLDWRLALFSLALLPFFVLLARRVGAQRRKITTVKQGAMADISSLVQESLSVSGILLGKTMGRGAELAERFERESENLADLEVRSRMAGRWMMAAIQTSFAVMPALVYLFAGPGARARPRSARSSPSPRCRRGSSSRSSRCFRSASTSRPRSRCSTASSSTWTCRSTSSPATRELHDVRGEVRFDGVWFRYGDEWTLRDVDIVVPPGTRTALVGETGAGKTSLGYLAARLYDPEQGAVRIDGVDLRELTFDALADAVGVVSQETYLFHASVRENLRFARPDATDEEIEDAARAAQIHDKIAALPDGYDTVVGERGFRFSGGEKQRIAIARTSCATRRCWSSTRRPARWTSQTERAVGEALEKLAEGRTTLVIAHRLSTVRDADQIVVLDARRGRRARHPRGAARARRPLRRAGRPRRRLADHAHRTSAELPLSDWPARSYGKRRAPPLRRHARRAARALRRPRRAGAGQAPDQRQGHPQRHGREHADQGPLARRRATSSPATVRALQATPDGSIGARKLAPGRRRRAGDRRRRGLRRRRRRRHGRARPTSPTARSAPASSPTARSPAPRSPTGR